MASSETLQNGRVVASKRTRSNPGPTVTPKAQLTGGRRLGLRPQERDRLCSQGLLSRAEQVPGEQLQLGLHPSPPSPAGYGFCVKTRKQSLSSLAGLTRPPQLPARALLPSEHELRAPVLSAPPSSFQAERAAGAGPCGQAGVRGSGVHGRVRQCTHQFCWQTRLKAAPWTCYPII